MMRPRCACATTALMLIGLAAAVVVVGGCGPVELLDPAEAFGELAGVVKGAGPAERVLTTGGKVEAGGSSVHAVGPAVAGDVLRVRVEISANGGGSSVALLDESMNLLVVQRVGSSGELEHIARRDHETVYVAVTAEHGGPYEVRVDRAAAEQLPGPRPQVVWLNFGGGRGVKVGVNPPIDFGVFDGAMVGPAYAGQTEALKAAIVATVRGQYAAYAVEILTSDEAPRPSGPHSTVYFGGYHEVRVGVADGVDRYNRDLSDNALVYVESFRRYGTMKLSAEQMGRMIGNTAAHELGHLLGLYHADGAENVMDTAGSAWDYAGERTLTVSQVAADVFPLGQDDAPRVLAETVGLRE